MTCLEKQVVRDKGRMVENVHSLHRFNTTVGINRTEQNRPKQDMYRYQKEDTNRKKKFIFSLDSTAVKGLFTPEFNILGNFFKTWWVSNG